MSNRLMAPQVAGDQPWQEPELLPSNELHLMFTLGGLNAPTAWHVRCISLSEALSCFSLQQTLKLNQIQKLSAFIDPQPLTLALSSCCRYGSRTAEPSGGRRRSAGAAAPWWLSTACMEPWSDTPSRCQSPSSNLPKTASWIRVRPGCWVRLQRLNWTSCDLWPLLDLFFHIFSALLLTVPWERYPLN